MIEYYNSIAFIDIDFRLTDLYIDEDPDTWKIELNLINLFKNQESKIIKEVNSPFIIVVNNSVRTVI